MHRILHPPNPVSPAPVSRRTLLEGTASASFVAGVAGCASGALFSGDAHAADPAPDAWSARKIAAFRIRQAAAQAHLDEQEPVRQSNGDEARYSDQRASFSKTLPHHGVSEVHAEAFATVVSVVSSGDPNRFETIPRDRHAEVGLNDPQATYAFELAGLDSAAASLDPPPAFSSALMAAEMAELYWLALTR